MSQEIKNNLKLYYDLESSKRNAGSPSDWKHGPRNEFLEIVKEENKNTILEIGAGTGKDSKFFADQGLTVTAVDLSGEMVKLCIEKGIDAYELDYTYISSLERNFDCIWSMNSLLHLEKAELPAVLSALNSVLVENGLLYIGVYGGEDKEEYKHDSTYPVARYFSFFSDNRLKDLVKKYYDIVSFKTIDLNQPFHFQSIILRKKKESDEIR